MTMTKTQILSRANVIVTGDRQNDYGEVEDNFGRIAGMWSAYVGADITSQDVACMLGQVKMARVKSGHHKDDNWVDIAGYAACGGSIGAKEKFVQETAEELDWTQLFDKKHEAHQQYLETIRSNLQQDNYESDWEKA